MTRGLATGVLVALLSGCEGDRTCGEEDVGNRNGFYLQGFSLAEGGRGYLDGYVFFAGCGRGYGSSGPRAFTVDANSRTTETIVVGDIDPGKIVLDSDGASGILMSYRDPLGLGHAGHPPGFLALEGVIPTLHQLGDAFDLQPVDSGAIASAGVGGSWIIEFGGEARQILAQDSRCGAAGAGRLLACVDAGVVVMDSSGATVTILGFSTPPVFVGGTPELAIVLVGTSLALIRNDAVESTVTVPDSAGLGWVPYAWISADSRYAIVRGQESFQFIDLTLPAVTFTVDDSQFPVTDVAFSGTWAIAVTSRDLWTFDFATGTAGWDGIWFDAAEQVEPLSGSTFLLASSQSYYTRFEPGDTLAGVFALYDIESGWGESWDLVVEE